MVYIRTRLLNGLSEQRMNQFLDACISIKQSKKYKLFHYVQLIKRYNPPIQNVEVVFWFNTYTHIDGTEYENIVFEFANPVDAEINYLAQTIE